MSDKLLNSAKVKEKFSGVTDMTLWRWLRDPNLGFPQPIYISRRRYWREAEINEFLSQQDLTAGAA